jgi:hypothetical protein
MLNVRVGLLQGSYTTGRFHLSVVLVACVYIEPVLLYWASFHHVHKYMITLSFPLTGEAFVEMTTVYIW